MYKTIEDYLKKKFVVLEIWEKGELPVEFTPAYRFTSSMDSQLTEAEQKEKEKLFPNSYGVNHEELGRNLCNYLQVPYDAELQKYYRKWSDSRNYDFLNRVNTRLRQKPPKSFPGVKWSTRQFKFQPRLLFEFSFAYDIPQPNFVNLVALRQLPNGKTVLVDKGKWQFNVGHPFQLFNPDPKSMFKNPNTHTYHISGGCDEDLNRSTRRLIGNGELLIYHYLEFYYSNDRIEGCCVERAEKILEEWNK